MKINYYYPYKSDKPEKKYYIITKSEKKIYFGQANASDMTQHKDEARRQRYIKRHSRPGGLASPTREYPRAGHEKNESKYWNKSGIDTPSFWALFLLWNKPSIKESYEDIKKRFL